MSCFVGVLCHRERETHGFEERDREVQLGQEALSKCHKIALSMWRLSEPLRKKRSYWCTVQDSVYNALAASSEAKRTVTSWERLVTEKGAL
jgi:hypothetical protein